MEMIALVTPRYDIGRFGSEVIRATPRQSDLMIVSGRVSHRMAAPIRQLYEQMLEPKWVLAMGACSSTGGMFANYAILQGVDKIIPVDVYVPGCPPRPEALMHGILRLRDKIHGHEPDGWRERYDAVGTEEVVSPEDAGSRADGAINVFPGGDTAGA
jgi:NADH-quinone oxidoreductase subunit B